MAVDCVIVSYNSAPDLPACLKSVAEQDEEIRPVVVDNVSADESLTVARENGATVLANETNVGFAAAANEGAAHGDAEWLLILNPDAQLTPGAVTTMQATATSAVDIGCVGPRTLDAEGAEYPSRRRFPDPFTAAGHAALGRVWPGNPATQRYHHPLPTDRPSTVDWLSGCCMLLPRHVWDAAGGFDPGYWMYLEDADLCWRLRRMGWRTVWEPTATITHTGGRSSRSRPVRSIVAHHRSAARFYWRTAGWHRPVTGPLAVAGLAARAGVQVLTRPRPR